jgi:hypothetical protein
MIERDNRVQLELAVVHPASNDHIAAAIGIFGGNPRHIGAVPRQELGRPAFDHRLAIGKRLVLGQPAQNGIHGERLPVRERKSQRPLGSPIHRLEVQRHANSS